MRHPAHRGRALVLILGLAGIGCGLPPREQVGSRPALDAGVDASSAPLRRLVTRRHLFGEGPVDNRFLDPNFALIDANAWNPINFFTGQRSVATAVHVPTPKKQPALRLTVGDGTQSRITGLAKGSPGPSDVSVWLGRTPSASWEDLNVSLVGLYPVGTRSFTLERDPREPERSLGGITWRRYAAQMAEGPIGWCQLQVIDRTPDPLYLSSPTLRPGSFPERRSRRLRRLGRSRPLTAAERQQIRAFWRQYLNRF